MFSSRLVMYQASSALSNASVELAVPRFRSALRKLAQHGVEALKPQLVVAKTTTPTSTSLPFTTTALTSMENENGHWHRPAISKRIARGLRKQAIAEGTYGSFDVETLRGWDPAWDVELARVQSRLHTSGGRYPRQIPPKKTTRERTREQRAAKLESKMEGMDERIEEYYVEKHKAKPPKTFENTYKNLTKLQR